MTESNRKPEEERTAGDLSFHRRALAEAARYGSDPWVFVRELLQNARDAGARRVVFETTVGNGLARIVCHDDGVGMTYGHAERYLFALYASSKEDEEDQAGQFGVGFWSVLRFQPSSIGVRSRTLGGPAWKVSLDGTLESVHIEEETEFAPASGTEIVLERSIDPQEVGAQVLHAARRHGRFLTQKSRPGRTRGKQELEVIVDGQRINEPFTLPSPSASFEGRGYRGVVALGSEPTVELFAHGLFVRSAQSLEELLDGTPRRTGENTAEALAELPSLAPQILLDSDQVELLLARSDARQNRHLMRLVRRAEKELSRLVQRKLDSLSPQPWYRPWLGALRERFEFLESRPLAAMLVGGVVVGSLLGLGIGKSRASFSDWEFVGGAQRPVVEDLVEEPGLSQEDLAWGGEGLDPPGTASFGPSWPGGEAAGNGVSGAPAVSPRTRPSRSSRSEEPLIRPYRDLASSYRGPQVDAEEDDGGPRALPALAYQPATEPLLFNALVVDDLATGRPTALAVADTSPYRDSPCTRDCILVQMMVEADAGLLRLPIPTGHRLSTTTVRLDGREYSVFETPQGEAVLRLTSPAGGFIEYQTGPAPAPEIGTRARLQIPHELESIAARFERQPRLEQISAALRFVSQRVTYSRSPEVVEAFAGERRAQKSFLQAALDVGGGDCDVQNGVLSALLGELGLEARMVLGFVGTHGVVASGLHAWVEVRGEDERWHAIDASLETPMHPLDGGGPETASPGPGLVPPDLTTVSASGGDQNLLLPWWRSPRWLLLAGLGVVAFGGVLFGSHRRRVGGQFDLGEGGDLAALLGGVLRHPSAFAAMPAVFHGRFIPLLGRRDAISLHQARRLAEGRRLFRSDGGCELAQRAAARGIPVVDGGAPEGAVLSRACGAIDLDHWQDLLARCHETEISRSFDGALQRLGESWRVKEAAALPEAAVELALENLRLGHRLVLIDLAHADFAPALPISTAAQRDFALLDLLIPHLELDPKDESRVVAHFAAAALEEAASREARS